MKRDRLFLRLLVRVPGKISKRKPTTLQEHLLVRLSRRLRMLGVDFHTVRANFVGQNKKSYQEFSFNVL